MKRMITLPDGREVWPKYPRWRTEMPGIKRPNRSRRHRGKMRLRYNSLYASDRKAAPSSPSAEQLVARLRQEEESRSRPTKAVPTAFGRVLDI